MCVAYTKKKNVGFGDESEGKVPGFWKRLVAHDLTRIHENHRLSLD